MDSIFEQIRKERGGIANIHSAFSDFPIGVSAHYDFYREIMLCSDLPLSRIEREFLAVKTSHANTCPYCINHHEVAYKNHLKEDKIPKKREVFFEKAATLLTQEPWKAMTLKEEAKESGLNPSEWQHTVMVIAYFNFANRCAHAMGLELETDFEKTCQ